MKINNIIYSNPKQAVLPILIQDYLDICDPVLTFDRFMGEIELEKYLKNIPQHDTGRLRYDPVSMLKTVLFGFMANGYISLRELEDQCKVNLRFMYLMDHQTPSYRTFGYFINEVLADSIEEIFQDINKKIFETEHVDLQHLYIDGSKFEANANKYSWVWKKSTEKSRYRLFDKITTLFEEINKELECTGIKFCINSEYAPEYLKEAAEQYAEVWQIDETMFVHGRGHRKTTQQRHYEKLREYTAKLEEYVEKIRICGEDRNSYSKTDHSATFMRIKTDYMGNDQLLPAYNVQVGVDCLEKLKICTPDVLLLDINMPRKNGLEVLQTLKSSKSKVKVLVLTVHNEVEYLMKAVDIGVDGYILKDSESAELKKAIFSIVEGENYIQPSLIPSLNSKMIEKNRDEGKIESLTKRELEVLKLLAVGMYNKEVAEKLNISERTVKNHVSNIFKKIEVTDRTQAAVFAIRNNLIEL
jgi:DNA-binding NarL/FixJ family response regulator/transposase